MTHIRFRNLIADRFADILTTNDAKSSQYAPDDDRLQHFKDVARLDIRGITPEEALWDMWKKHIVAMQYLIQRVKETGIYPNEETLSELVRDNVFYPILLEGLLTERREKVT